MTEANAATEVWMLLDFANAGRSAVHSADDPRDHAPHLPHVNFKDHPDEIVP